MKSLSKITLCLTTLLMAGTIASVSATFQYAAYLADSTKDELSFQLTPFVYTPEEMPDVEVTAVQRLSDILNGKYTTENVDDSLRYLLDKTITKTWGDPSSPYVGSMDSEREAQVDELFGDVLELQNEQLSFILKSQDLNGDAKNEIAIYTTTDTLDNKTDDYEGVVCVYVTVFTPVLDAKGNITGYKQVCESVRGYCYEINYSENNDEPSFSTDEWRDSVAYTSWGRDIELSEAEKKDFNCYNLQCNPTWISSNYTKPYGKTLSEVLKGQL